MEAKVISAFHFLGEFLASSNVMGLLTGRKMKSSRSARTVCAA